MMLELMAFSQVRRIPTSSTTKAQKPGRPTYVEAEPKKDKGPGSTMRPSLALAGTREYPDPPSRRKTSVKFLSVIIRKPCMPVDQPGNCD
jgi:hypothetical protein